MFGLFGSKDSSEKKEKEALPWQALTSMDQLDSIVEASNSIPIVIFKHSTRCGISRMVLRNFESTYDIDSSQIKLYYLDLLNYRNISDEVGYKFQVVHQSPQLIVIKNGVAVAHASHHSIRAEELTKFV
ncbi:bacillithiol system redox-active protein YtxJ [Jejudonia soesokkakensis]|uniref:Bacillithiol system redox-active protein YtxJ n=1 Tax=Jejudonia soesokkakensis TaxID=1323432 RepID=A0ABW2MVK2_9FLAO